MPGATAAQRHYSLIESNMAATGQTQAQAEAAMLQQIPAHRFAGASELAVVVAFLASAVGFVAAAF